MNNAEAFLLLFVGFLTVLAAVISIQQELFPFSRVVILCSVGLACVIYGGVFYRMSKPKQPTKFEPVTSVPTMKQRLKMTFFVCIMIFEAIFLLPSPFLSWQFAFIDSMPVVTIGDLFLIGCFIAGLVIARVLIRFFRSTPEERIDFF